MAQNRLARFGPVALSAVLTTNILNCAVTSEAGPVGYTQPQPYLLIKHIRIVNKTALAATVSLWIGATGGNAAGTEFAFQGYSVPANSFVDWYGVLRLDVADFLVGGAGTATALTFQAEGEIGTSG
jgi:hypothetical protein